MLLQIIYSHGKRKITSALKNHRLFKKIFLKESNL